LRLKKLKVLYQSLLVQPKFADVGVQTLQQSDRAARSELLAQMTVSFV